MIKRLVHSIKKHKVKVSIALILLLAWLFCLPKPLFPNDYATVVESSEGRLLGARIASDGQWRFPPADAVPQKFETCIRYFEDEYFYKHPDLIP